MGYGYGMMHGGWFGGGVFMLIFWGVVLIGGFFLFRWLMVRSRSSQEPVDNTSLEILKQRYARGEITHEEFEKMKANIS